MKRDLKRLIEAIEHYDDCRNKFKRARTPKTENVWLNQALQAFGILTAIKNEVKKKIQN